MPFVDPRKCVAESARSFCVAAAVTLPIASVFLIYVALGPMSVAWQILCLAAVFAPVGLFYQFVRHDVRIATFCNSIALIILGMLSGFPASCQVFYTGRGFPFVDDWLATADALLGFDWRAYLAWFDRHPGFDHIARMAYNSIFLQPFVLAVVLAGGKKATPLYELIVAMALALLVTMLVALILPAIGTYDHLHISAADHPHLSLMTGGKMLAPIEWLRSGAPDGTRPEMVGLISFPSYHAASAVLYARAAWHVPWLRWLFLAVEGLMLVATPVHGSHYLVDILGGIAVAILATALTSRLFGRLSGGDVGTRWRLVGARSGGAVGAAQNG